MQQAEEASTFSKAEAGRFKCHTHASAWVVAHSARAVQG